VELETGRVLRGIARDSEDRPVPGVHVSVYAPDNSLASLGEAQQSFLGGGRGAAGHAKSRDDGTFEIAGLPEAQVLELWARKQGWLPIVPLRVHETQEKVQVRLAPTFGVTFQLQDAETGESLGRLEPQVSWSMPANMFPMSRHGAALSALLREDESLGSGHTVSFQMLPAFKGSPPQGDAALLRYSFSALGYKKVEGAVKLLAGQIVDATVAMQSTAAARLPVRFTAHFPDKSPYTGQLHLYIRPENESDPAGSARLTFANGESDGAVSLPIGRSSITPHGGASMLVGHTEWWSPAGETSTVELSSQHRTPSVALVLRGQQIVVRVKDKAGKSVRGFDFGVGRSTSRTYAPRWDVYQEWVTRQWGRPFDRPRVLLPPGPWVLQASVPGGPTAVGTLEVGQSGTVEVDLVFGSDAALAPNR
jgi:hypothetical protein